MTMKAQIVADHRPLPIVALRTLFAAFVALIGVTLFAPAALGISSAARGEQVRYAWETADLSYETFLARKANFTAAGCNPDQPTRRRDCGKPAPYNEFVWTTDGCSGKWWAGRSVYKTLFAGPCEQHDFGYRNIGKGLTLDRSNSARSRIDDKLRDESKRICKQKYPSRWRVLNRQACFKEADVMRSYFRSRFAENWDKACPAGQCRIPEIRDPVPTPGIVTSPPVDPSSPGPPNPMPTDPGGADPASGVTETAGGVVHTWTNYTNAGGVQGPSIAAGQSVRIACRLQGFRVANGNPWWYRIASSPWNGVYYASADAFYNNGAVSGSLAGTPFVDSAVPECQGAAAPPAPTWSETTGGVANTWTNYTNAGGTQGPSIGSNQTVQIACKVTGFRVANGNTWWYRISSHPWNDQFYVSADAFYNNGATSGSLVGTPFVDPNVPNC